MKIGDLVTHYPEGSVIETVLRKLDGASDSKPEFLMGVVVECKGPRSQIFSYQLPNHISWFDNKELKDID